MSEPRPVLTEQVTDAYGTYTAEWHTDPPPPGVTYRVTDSTWAPDHSVRRIYAIAIGQGRDRRRDPGAGDQ